MQNNSSPQPLKKGDLIYICSPAKAIEEKHLYYAKKLFEERGYRVKLSEHCLGQFNYFSGTDEERTNDLQSGLDDPEVKAIICARGGYGAIRILDRVQWAGMLRDPKWIVGFSDITVLHQRLQRFGMVSIHGTMPLNFTKNSKESIDSLFAALEGLEYTIKSKHHANNKHGLAKGRLIGGNLSILYSLLGTDDQPDYEGSILFIEDLAEQLYHIDRMFYSFKKAGVLEKISGLIVGGMTDLKDTATPIGMTLEEIILAHFQFRKIPICFDFPAGHISDNRALIIGKEAFLEVLESGSTLAFTN